MADSEQATEIFVNAWAAYQKLLKNDYLSHLVLYGGLTEALKTFKDGEQFKLLDLGCGDAHYIADALQHSGAGGRLRQYTGVDLAGDALKLARQNITDATDGGGCDLDIQQANMLEYAAAADAQPAYDMALTSFAAHHLRTEEKEEFLRGVGRRMKPGGIFFVVDSFRRPGESLQAYMDRFCQWARDTWTELTPAEQQHFEDHMRSYDIQEPVDVYQEFATNAGFGQAREIAGDGNFMKVLAFQRQ